jgi:hypothetical protein
MLHWENRFLKELEFKILGVWPAKVALQPCPKGGGLRPPTCGMGSRAIVARHPPKISDMLKQMRQC